MTHKQADIFTAEEFRKISKGKRKKPDKKEERIQLQVCKYIKKQYPNVVFFCDMASGLRLPIWLGKLHKGMRSSRGIPDLFIANVKMRADHTIWATGLFIELKRPEARLKNGGIAASKHHKEQEAILRELRFEGYRAEFACGFEEAKKLIDEYLDLGL